MKKIISANLAGKILVGAFILMLVLHVLILLQVVPSSIVWGGQVNADQSNLLPLEILYPPVLFGAGKSMLINPICCR